MQLTCWILTVNRYRPMSTSYRHLVSSESRFLIMLRRCFLSADIIPGCLSIQFPRGGIRKRCLPLKSDERGMCTFVLKCIQHSFSYHQLIICPPDTFLSENSQEPADDKYNSYSGSADCATFARRPKRRHRFPRHAPVLGTGTETDE